MFVNTSAFGGYPEMVQRREAWQPRWGKWPSAIAALLVTLRRARPLRVRLNGVERSVWMLFVGNGPYVPTGMVPSYRPRLDTGVLEVRYLRADRRLARTRAFVALATGVLGHNRIYQESAMRSLDIELLDGPVEVAADGEVVGRGRRLRYSSPTIRSRSTAATRPSGPTARPPGEPAPPPADRLADRAWPARARPGVRARRAVGGGDRGPAHRARSRAARRGARRPGRGRPPRRWCTASPSPCCRGCTPDASRFPSAHAATAAAYTAGAALESRGVGATLVPASLAVTGARVALGDRRPLEVGAGAVLGVGIALLTTRWWPAVDHHPARARPAASRPRSRRRRRAGRWSPTSPPAPRDRSTPSSRPTATPPTTVPSALAADRRDPPRAQVLVPEPGVDFVVEVEAALRRPAPDGALPRAVGVAGGDGSVAAIAGSRNATASRWSCSPRAR